MKYIKLFEKKNKKRFWLIYGSYKEINDIVKKYTKLKYDFIQDAWQNSKIIGCYVGYSQEKAEEEANAGSDYPGYDYWEIEDVHNDFINGKMAYQEDDYIFQGEMKLVNDKIVIDSFLADTEKYNL